MSDFRLGSGIFFDRGIDSITFKGGTEALALPTSHELTPADHAERPQLDQLLALPNLDNYLDQAVRPGLENRDLLLPSRFRQALTAALAALEKEAASTPNAETAKVLNRAVRLLTEETALRDLLQMYRSVLYQG